MRLLIAIGVWSVLIAATGGAAWTIAFATNLHDKLDGKALAALVAVIAALWGAWIIRAWDLRKHDVLSTIETETLRESVNHFVDRLWAFVIGNIVLAAYLCAGLPFVGAAFGDQIANFSALWALMLSVFTAPFIKGVSTRIEEARSMLELKAKMERDRDATISELKKAREKSETPDARYNGYGTVRDPWQNGNGSPSR